ncbi:MAG: sugar ABC transporter permease [Candidatus Atribacteria bacterium]|nr:sugar ABC transporter permease [Candidatus Atribacteria bacterium]
MERHRKKRSWYGYVFLLPAILVLLALTIFPLIYSLNISFRNVTLLKLNQQPFVGLANFLEIFKDPRFYNAILKTLIFCIALPFEFFIGLGIAVLYDRLPRQGALRMLFLIPMIIAPIVVALMWRFMFNPNQGIFNYFLQTMGWKAIPWLSESGTALASVIMVEVWQWTPFFFLVLYTGLRNVPLEPIEAAMVDGASRYKVFRFVKFPFLKTLILVTILIRLMDILKNFDLLFGLTQGGPGISTEVLNFYTYIVGFKWFKLGYSSSLSYVLLVIIIIISNIFIKIFQRE